MTKFFDAWNRQDLQACLTRADPDIEYVNAPSAVSLVRVMGMTVSRSFFAGSGRARASTPPLKTPGCPSQQLVYAPAGR